MFVLTTARRGSRMAAEVMDFDCKMKNTGSTEFSEWGKLELRWNRSVGRAVEAGFLRERAR